MTTTTVSPTRLPQTAARVLVAAGAVLAAVLLWALFLPLLGLDVTVPAAPGSEERTDLALSSVVGAATVASLAGWALLAALERLTARATTVWTAVALLVLVVSLPYLPGFTLTERVVLAALHGAVAAVLVPGLRATARQGRPTAG